MRRIMNLMLVLAGFLFLTAACNTIKNLPTNTTGGLFSLNGTWQLTSTTDGQALKGTIINVYPVIGNGTIKTLQNNTYCLKEGDQIWRSVKSSDSGFTMQSLVSACNGATVSRDATITIVNNDEVAVTTRTAAGAEMIQQWKRVTTK